MTIFTYLILAVCSDLILDPPLQLLLYLRARLQCLLDRLPRIKMRVITASQLIEEVMRAGSDSFSVLLRFLDGLQGVGREVRRWLLLWFGNRGQN
jgi:hypothetical protein